MRKIACLLMVLFSMSASAWQTVIVVRHAEKADPKDPDTSLSASGHTRASRLADVFKRQPVHAILHSELKRTKETVQVLAKEKNLTSEAIPASNVNALIERIKSSQKDAVVVVAGHSNTIPSIIKSLGVKESVSIADDQYDSLFIISNDLSLIELKY